MFILKLDHIRALTANLQSLQFVTPVIMHAYCYFHHQLVKEWKDTLLLLWYWNGSDYISQNNSFVVFSVKYARG